MGKGAGEFKRIGEKSLEPGVSRFTLQELLENMANRNSSRSHFYSFLVLLHYYSSFAKSVRRKELWLGDEGTAGLLEQSKNLWKKMAWKFEIISLVCSFKFLFSYSKWWINNEKWTDPIIYNSIRPALRIRLAPKLRWLDLPRWGERLRCVRCSDCRCFFGTKMSNACLLRVGWFIACWTWTDNIAIYKVTLSTAKKCWPRL